MYISIKDLQLQKKILERLILISKGLIFSDEILGFVVHRDDKHSLR